MTKSKKYPTLLTTKTSGYMWNGCLVCLLIFPLAETFAPLNTRWDEHERVRVVPSPKESSPWALSTRLSTRGSRVQDYWEFEEDDEFEERYPVREKYVGGSQAERDLKSMSLNGRAYDYYDDDADEEVLELDRTRQRDSSRRKLRRDIDLYYDDDDDGDDDVDESFEDEPIGNFWSNPDASLDRAPLAPAPRRPPRRNRGDAPPRKRKRTTFRSGIPEPPPPVKDFYNRLFWYGFDPNDTNSPADKTMFGGTKGKFNGLAFMYDGGPKLPPEQRRRRPRDATDEEEDYYYDELDEKDQADYPMDRVDSTGRTLSGRLVTPPYDKPSALPSDPTEVPPRQRARRRQRRGRRNYIDEDEDSYRRPGRRSSQVAAWFDVDAEIDDEDLGEQRSRRSRGKDEDEKPFNPFEIFFGMNRENLSRQAEEYNRQMGLGEERPRRRRNPNRPQRAGFAYPYDAEEDDIPPVAEFETEPEDSAVPESRSTGALVERVDKSTSSPSRRELTWEERAMAIDRVPPADIPAWGPCGDLGVDARSYAISEAMQDILEAKQKVEEKEAKLEQRREELSIRKVDGELERKRIRQLRQDLRREQQMLREVELDIEDAARAFRYAQLRLKSARDEMMEVEARHWAVLSFYSPSQATNGIEEAFREFEESEPAARRYREKMMNEQMERDKEIQQENGDSTGQKGRDENALS